MKKRSSAPPDPDTRPMERVVRLRHVLLGAAVGGLLYWRLADAREAVPRGDYLRAVTIACALLAAAVTIAAAMFQEANRRVRRVGDMYRAIENILGRNQNFLFDNPWISANPQVRRALLPTDEELVAIPLHPTVKHTLRAFREAKHPFMKGGTRCGERYVVEPPLRIVGLLKGPGPRNPGKERN